MIHPPFEKANALTATGIRHGFFGRRCKNSGVGPGLNTSETIDGDPDGAAQNRRLAMTALGVGDRPLASLHQTHSTQVITLKKPPALHDRPEADGLVTTCKDIALGIITADCAPILFADIEAGVIGACHAGWQGAVNGIIENTITAMMALGATPNNIAAAIGPTISGVDYEVGPERAAEIIAANAQTRQHIFVPKNSSREHFDLPGFATAQIKQAGVELVEIVGSSTYSSPKRYFSHRHTTKHGTPAGRQIAIIALK